MYNTLDMIAYVLRSLYDLLTNLLFYQINIEILGISIHCMTYQLLGIVGVGVFITILIIKAIRG